jgi:hypothetical protein
LIYLLDLNAENAKLKAQNKQLQQKLDQVSKELRESRELNKVIMTINDQFGRENDVLYKKLESYEMLRTPQSMRNTWKRKHSNKSDRDESSSDESSADESGFRNFSDTEKNEKNARVCIIFLKWHFHFSVIIYYLSIHLDGNESHLENNNTRV